MIELLVGLSSGTVLVGTFILGLYTGHRFSKTTQAPKWFQAPVNTERTQALKERQNEDDYLKTFMDKYNKSLYMSQEDFAKEQKNV